MTVDLHMHSTYSDGELTPEALVEEAKRRSVCTMAITDHDEIAGYRQAKTFAAKDGIQLISGIELNTDGEQGELHILGYDLDSENKRLMDYIDWRQQARKLWSKRIVAKLNELGFLIDWEDCWQRAGQQVIVRTHIADELVDQGYFGRADQAFQSLLVKGAPAFVKRESLSAIEAIELIHHAGGKAFLAHPGIYTWDWSLQTLLNAGLDGIEVYYAKHNEEETVYWNEIANQYQLLKSVGSDFHGPTSRSPFPIGSVEFEQGDIHWVKNELVKEDVR